MPRLALLVTVLVMTVPAPTLGIDLDLYDRLLERHTRAVKDIASTRVDYRAVREDPEWAELVESLAETDPDGFDRDEKLAFYVNAYNILAIDVVAKNHPVKSIKDVGSLLRPVWKRTAGTIDGRPVTLDGIENATLRPLGDPRIHAAIVCASLSCPPLRREAYRVEQLEAQLDDNMRRWLADPRKGVRADAATGTLYVSSIFKWFADDFEPQGGTVAFVERYGPEEAARVARRTGENARIRYLDYDWSVNDLARAGVR